MKVSALQETDQLYTAVVLRGNKACRYQKYHFIHQTVYGCLEMKQQWT